MLDENILGLLIPMSAIVLGIGAGIIKTITKSQERRLELRLQAQQGQNDTTAQQIAALRQEIAALRDTSTQFDVSLDTTLQRLEERVGRLETKTVTTQASAPEAILRSGCQ